MNRWLIRSVQIAALAMGGLLVTGGAAQADGILSNNVTGIHVSVPVSVSHNALGLLGTAVSGSGMNNGITDGYHHGNGNGTGGANSVGNGNHHANHHNGTGGANSVGGANGDGDGDGDWNGNGGGLFGGNGLLGGGLLSGNHTNVGVAIPISIDCNAVAILGSAYANCG